MSPWEIFLALLSWVGLMLACFLVLFIVWLVLDSIWREFIKSLQRRRRDLDKYLLEARAIADQYRDETAPEFREGFLAGSRWGWGYFTRITKR